MSIIGNRIKERRESLGLTQEQLAQIIGYKSKSSINKIEMGINDITQSKVKAFADALETTPAYLMGWTKSHYESNDPDQVIRDAAESAEMALRFGNEFADLFDIYKNLNEVGKKEALKRVTELAHLKQYTE